MSGQLESRHFFKVRDTVQNRDGAFGTVLEGRTLYATVVWSDGRQEEVEQFDSRVVVVERAEPQ